MAVSFLSLIVAAVAVLIAVLVLVRITLGSSRYGRRYDKAARNLKEETRDQSDSEFLP